MNDQDKIQALKNGNTKALEALMDMVNQSFQHINSDENIIYHSYMSCDEQAIEVLVEAGLSDAVDTNLFCLRWDKLEERKEEALLYEKSKRDEAYNRNR